MIGGVEAVHSWDAGAAVLNRRDLWPHFRVDSVTGLVGRADFAPETDPAIGRRGEIPRDGDLGGKTITYEGIVKAKTLGTLIEYRGDLEAAFDGTGERKMLVTPHPAYAGSETLPERFYFAEPRDVQIEEAQTARPHRRSRGHERPGSIQLRLSDPRYYWNELVEASDDTLVELSGTGFPFTPPVTLRSASTDGIALTLDNLGNAPTDAIFTINGPCRNPVLSNETTNRFLRFRDLTVDTGESIEIDFRRRTAVRPGVGVDVRHKLDASSTWWDGGEDCLLPGENDVQLRAFSLAAPASLDAAFYPADSA